MPNIYRRKAGNRRYIDYTKEQLEQCLNDVRSKIRTQRAAAAKYKIPRSTIKNKLKNKHCNKPGHSTIFTTEEEQAFVAHVTALSEFGFPITDIDLKIIIKDYLSARGRQAIEDWHQVLLDWKNTPEGRRLPTVPKDQFPRLLKTALDSMKETQSYLVNGFRKTGIYPQNVEEPLSRLPRQDRIVDLNLISGAFMQDLKQLRSNDSPNRKNQGKKKKLDVPAGRSIRSEDISDKEQASSSGVNRSDPKKNAKSRKRFISEVSSSECSDTDISLASSTEDLILARDQSDDEEDNLRLAQLTNRNPRSNYDGNLEALGPSTQLPEPIPPDCNTRFIEDPLSRNCSKSDGQSCSNEDENKEGPPLPNKINPDDVQKAEEEYQNGDGYCINDHYPEILKQSQKVQKILSNISLSTASVLQWEEDDFKNCFKDFNEIAIVAQFVVSPFMEIDIQQFATSVTQNISEDIAATEMEVIAFQNYLALTLLVSNTKCIWPSVSKDKYSVLCRVTLEVKLLFSSTYSYESYFSNIKSKYRNRLTDEHLDNCIRMAVSNYTPNIKKIVSESECQASH
ncbi:unnamed protein product [Acanthoscelides obtectus]|uniref:HTH psq-type domain-containing protein n=1 Tax=Acanthoscelides obtectus TaxID=200917 RepID=A0A9P0MBJ5_ACAOB|nr:unnamed protein product [Acanthoscelides obtectus]CAK1643337.1 hypothetical protein AOBTE_LOCUS13502 [Acanthoscelides obtectus]